MLIVIVPLVRSRQNKGLTYTRIISQLLADTGSSLGIVTIIMSLGKIYYDPQHAAGFGSVAKLVKLTEGP